VTPYAVLLVRPVDDDAVIRRRYHALATGLHPDRQGGGGIPSEGWQAVKEAYEAVKTEVLRAEWARSRAALAGLCTGCGGLGVTWRRTGKDRGVRLCTACEGAGRKLTC
jgi:hypothetical protein